MAVLSKVVFAACLAFVAAVPLSQPHGSIAVGKSADSIHGPEIVSFNDLVTLTETLARGAQDFAKLEGNSSDEPSEAVVPSEELDSLRAADDQEAEDSDKPRDSKSLAARSNLLNIKLWGDCGWPFTPSCLKSSGPPGLWKAMQEQGLWPSPEEVNVYKKYRDEYRAAHGEPPEPSYLEKLNDIIMKQGDKIVAS